MGDDVSARKTDVRAGHNSAVGHRVGTVNSGWDKGFRQEKTPAVPFECPRMDIVRIGMDAHCKSRSTEDQTDEI